jgi:hypothetical protein
MKKVLWVLTAILVILHQDLWNWAKDKPLIGGFLPIGLWYHALFCVAASVLLALFVLFAWPSELENAEPETPEAREAEGYPQH